MTAPATLERPAAVAAPALTPAEIVASRQRIMQALDGPVQALLRRQLATGLISAVPRMVELTAYDAVYLAAPAVGGHWTVAGRRRSFFGVQVESYTITLEFDEEQRPVRFRVCGASEVLSTNATTEALDTALTAARRSGPQTGWAPAVVPGISL
jgi:hypothetical protein